MLLCMWAVSLEEPNSLRLVTDLNKRLILSIELAGEERLSSVLRFGV